MRIRMEIPKKSTYCFFFMTDSIFLLLLTICEIYMHFPAASQTVLAVDRVC